MRHAKNLAFGARLRFALDGLRHALRSERSFRTQVAVLVLVALALAILRPEPLWWALVALASSGVLGAELLNTAIEQLADHLHPDVHASIRVVKDCAAAGVLVTALGAVGVGVALLVHLVTK